MCSSFVASKLHEHFERPERVFSNVSCLCLPPLSSGRYGCPRDDAVLFLASRKELDRWLSPRKVHVDLGCIEPTAVILLIIERNLSKHGALMQLFLNLLNGKMQVSPAKEAPPTSQITIRSKLSQQQR